MRNLISRPREEHFPDDIDRIVRVCADNGYRITRSDAIRIWRDYSDTLCAQWMGLPDRDVDLLWKLLRYGVVQD